MRVQTKPEGAASAPAPAFYALSAEAVASRLDVDPSLRLTDGRTLPSVTGGYHSKICDMLINAINCCLPCPTPARTQYGL